MPNLFQYVYLDYRRTKIVSSAMYLSTTEED